MNLTSSFLNNLATDIRNEIRNRKIPGMSVIITDDNKDIFNQAFGYKDYNRKQKADNNTSYYIASLTKSFTALAFGILHQNKTINIFEPVKNYISRLSMKDAYVYDHITFIDILSHRSGIQDDVRILEEGLLQRSEFINWLNDYDECIKFRENFIYNNILYSIAGQFIEEITGLSWEKYIESEILNKMGIDKYDFSFTYSDENKNKLKLYYQQNASIKEIVNKQKHDGYNSGGPAGSINLTTGSLGKWLRLFLNEGKIDNRKIINPEIIDELLKPRIIIENNVSYCMGWFCKNINNDVILFHTGSFGNYMALSIKHKIGLGVCSNIHNDYAELIMNKIVQRLSQ